MGFSRQEYWSGLPFIWAPNNWCFWTVVLEKTLESPLDCKEIQPVYPKGNQSWIFIGRTDVEAETPVLGHLMQRIDSLEKTLMLGKIEDRRRKGRQRWLDRITDSMDMSLSKHWWWTGKPGVQQSMGLQKVRHDWETELNWTERHTWVNEVIKLWVHKSMFETQF